MGSPYCLQWSSELHWAAGEGDTETLERLLRAGHTPNQPGNVSCWIRGAYEPAKRTPLHHAAKRGHLGCIRLLLRYGGDPNSQDEDGYTPLHYLCQIHSPQEEEGKAIQLAATSLLDFGADPQRVTTGGHTPLALAVQQKNTFCRCVLDQHGMAAASTSPYPNLLYTVALHVHTCKQSHLPVQTTITFTSNTFDKARFQYLVHSCQCA